MKNRITQDMSQKLAESAFSLFSRQGLDKVKMDDIAKQAGVTKGSLYWHYTSKDEVIMAACQHYYKSWHISINRQLARISDPLEKLKFAIQSSVKSCLIDYENRIFTTEIFALSLHDKNIQAGWRQFFDSVKAVYIGLADAAKYNGQLDVDDSEQAVGLMLSAMEGYKLRAIFEPELCSPEAEKMITTELFKIFSL